MKDVRRVIAHLFTVGGVIVVCGTFHFPPLQADDGKLPHWAQDGYGASADGQSPYLGPQNGKLKWMFGLDRWACSPVVGADSTVYVGTNNGTFYAIDKEGREKWKRQWPIKNANVTDEGGIIKQHPAGSTFEIERDWITIGVDGGRSVLVQVGRVESVQDHLGMYDAARSGDSTRALALGEKLAETQSKDPMIALKSQLSMARAYALCVGHLASRNEILDREDQMSRAVDRCLGILETILSNPLVDQNPAAKRGLRRERDFDAIRQRPDFAKLFESHE